MGLKDSKKVLSLSVKVIIHKWVVSVPFEHVASNEEKKGVDGLLGHKTEEVLVALKALCHNRGHGWYAAARGTFPASLCQGQCPVTCSTSQSS